MAGPVFGALLARIRKSKQWYSEKQAVVLRKASSGTSKSKQWYSEKQAVVPRKASSGTPKSKQWYSEKQAVVPRKASSGTAGGGKAKQRRATQRNATQNKTKRRNANHRRTTWSSTGPQRNPNASRTTPEANTGPPAPPENSLDQHWAISSTGKQLGPALGH